MRWRCLGSFRWQHYWLQLYRLMFWVLLPITCSIPGANSSLSPAPHPRSRRAFPKRPGAACRPAKEPRGRVCTDWAHLELADLDASEYNDDLAGEWTRGSSDAPQHRRRQLGLFLHMVSQRHVHPEAGVGGRPSLGRRRIRRRNLMARLLIWPSDPGPNYAKLTLDRRTSAE